MYPINVEEFIAQAAFFRLEAVYQSLASLKRGGDVPGHDRQRMILTICSYG